MVCASFRAKTVSGIIFFAVVVASSFAIGLYLRFRYSPPPTVETVEPPSLPELLAKAEATLKSRQTEQALLLFRQAEALDPARRACGLDLEASL